jgi:hypothetical protein
MVWLKWILPLHQQIKITAMNTDNTLAFISTMISSESSYRALVDMINEMDLELMDICMA